MSGSELVARIDKLLEDKQLKRQSLSVDLGLPLQTISNWKTRGNLPSADLLYQIDNYLGVSLEWLLTGKEPVQPALRDSERDILHDLSVLNESDLETVKIFTHGLAEKRRSESAQQQTAG